MVARLQSVWKAMWERQYLPPEIEQYMTERYILHGMQSIKYSLAGGLLLAVFELNQNNYILIACWGYVFVMIQALHYFMLKDGLSKPSVTVPWYAYVLGMFIIIWWLAFLFFFGWQEPSAFIGFWRGAIIFIVMVFYLDAMQYAKKILLTHTLTIALGLLVYLHGFTSVPSESVARMSVSIVFGCVALLLSGLASFLLNLEVAKVVIKNRKSIVVLDEMASRDSLTKLYNRRYFDARLQHYIGMYQQENQKFSLALMDIDYFKDINDTYGHQAGDAALVQLGSFVSQTLRSADLFGRYGGEEFIILLPGADLEDSTLLMQHLRAAVASHVFNINGLDISFTISVGVSMIQHDDDAERLLARVDEALYKAKGSGRNKVETL